MKVSLKWLSKLVDINGLSAEEIADKLTFAGVEVEDISYLASGTNLVIGEVLKCENMENSDHLHICEVNLGDKFGVKQIVCGAPNVKVGEKVIVARDGAKLPGGEIRVGKIRGVESNGMLCSLSELGVDSKYLSEEQLKGIELLDSDAKVGDEEVLKYLGLDDAILDLKLLANRSDLNAMNNVAKEVATLFNRKLYLEEVKDLSNFTTDAKIGIETDYCSQFSLKEVRNIKVKESPKWMKEYLRSMGVRSINNIVDIGNYVMLLTGQPLHMYDKDKLPLKSLVVKDNLPGDFVALDEKTYALEDGDIVITSDNKVMCLGGVMGSLECAVDENTKNIYIEAATFEFSHIRKTSNRLGLVSESSQRFVKGINHHQYDYVLDLTSKLLKDLCDAKEISNTVTINNNKDQKVVIKTSVNKINNRLGTSFTLDEIVNTLKLDHMEVSVNDNDLVVTVPYQRIDITTDADISEEVIRLLGYHNVKSILPTLELTVGSSNESVAKKRLIRDYLRGQGLDDILTYSLVSKANKDRFAFINKDSQYRIINPMSDEREYYRSNLLHSLLEVASYNYSRQIKDLSFFEVSDIDTLNEKQTHLGIVLLGNELYQDNLKKVPYDFYHMKGYLLGIMDALNIEGNRYTLSKLDMDTTELHPYRSAKVMIGKDVVGVLGELHPSQYEKYNLGKEKVIVMELRLDKLFELKSSRKKFVAPNKYPYISRDISVVVKDNITSKEIIDTIKKVDRTLIKDAYVFDEYKGEHLDKGYKSLSFTIIYQSEEKTLKDEDVTSLEEKVLKELDLKFLARLR